MNNYDILLDVISLASFILQIQNREGQLLAELKTDLSEKLDKQINAKLDQILMEIRSLKS